MFDKMKLSADDFQIKVILASATKPVVVDFWAEWCGPCLAMAPTYEAVASEYSDRVSFYKLNVDEEPASAQQFNVMSIPTLIFFKNGQPTSQLVGVVQKRELVEHVLKLLNP